MRRQIVIGYGLAVLAAAAAADAALIWDMYRSGMIGWFGFIESLPLIAAAFAAFALLFSVSALVPFWLFGRIARQRPIRHVGLYLLGGAVGGALGAVLLLGGSVLFEGWPYNPDYSNWVILTMAFAVAGAVGGLFYWWWSGRHTASLPPLVQTA